jgi:hypothetical protein
MVRNLVQRPAAPWRPFLGGFATCAAPVAIGLAFKALTLFGPSKFLENLDVIAVSAFIAGMLGGAALGAPALVRAITYWVVSRQ